MTYNINKKPTPARDPGIDADEVAGLLAARREFGPEAEPAVIAAFLERTGQIIDARVDQRIAQHRWGPSMEAENRRTGPKLALAIASMILAIPLTGIAAALDGDGGIALFLIVWSAIVAINVLFHRSLR